MASYRLLFKKSVAKDLRRIPKADVRRLLCKIDSLVENPRPVGAKKLSGQGYYRVRLGVYRIIYDIQDAKLVILVIRVGHRSSSYQSSG